jgi:hypothetical protein
MRINFRILRNAVSKFARDAQIFRYGKHLGVGSFSRKGAKTPSSEKTFFSSKPLRLRAFAGDIPRFGAALLRWGLRELRGGIEFSRGFGKLPYTREKNRAPRSYRPCSSSTES